MKNTFNTSTPYNICICVKINKKVILPFNETHSVIIVDVCISKLVQVKIKN